MVSPIDFHERKSPRLSRSAWTAIALVAAAHVGVGVALYYQRFELNLMETEPAPTEGVFLKLEPRPVIEPEKVEHKPAAPNMPIHETPAPARPTEVLSTPINPDATPTSSTTVTLGHPVTESVNNEPPARETVVEPPAVRVIRNPSWVSQPTGDQMMRAYPNRALERGLAGSATLNCMVEANGRVSGCTITGETPAGNGFGRSAQQLSRYFQINPRTVDGAAEGSRVAINLRFVPPAD
jgi:protein TonB